MHASRAGRSIGANPAAEAVGYLLRAGALAEKVGGLVTPSCRSDVDSLAALIEDATGLAYRLALALGDTEPRALGTRRGGLVLVK
jgi:hypothetical protein